MPVRPTPTLLTGAIGLGLGIGLAVAVVPRVATGYPATAVSTGANPVVSAGGLISVDSSETAISADTGQDVVITDLVMGITNTYSYYCEANFQVSATLADGTVVGRFAVGMPNLDQSQLRNEIVSFRSGLRVPAGDSLTLSLTAPWRDCGDSYYTLNYTVSGYQAQP
jgi:hypothetical protein